MVVSVFTEKFGIQSYIVNGIRTAGKNNKSQYFQPSALLDLQVYHNELKSLQRIKEVKWSILLTNIFSDIFKNAVAIYAVELLTKCLKQPEVNEDLFRFCTDFFQELNDGKPSIAANMPLYFAIHFSAFLGLKIQDNFSAINPYFDYKEGNFTNRNDNYILTDKETSLHLAELLKTLQPHDLQDIKLSQHRRILLLNEFEKYYAWHVPDFGKMKSLAVLKQLF